MKEIVFFSARLDDAVLDHLERIGNASRKKGRPSAVLAEIIEVIQKSEIEVEAEILENYRPSKNAKLSLIFENKGRVQAYFYEECDHGDYFCRHWWKYGVHNSRPVILSTYPAAIVRRLGGLRGRLA